MRQPFNDYIFEFVLVVYLIEQLSEWKNYMKYVLKKFLTLIATLFLVSIITFLIFQVVPGNPVLSILGTEATDEKIADLEEELGLNKPLPERYFDWLSGVVKGDFGKSYRYKENLNDIPASVRVTGNLPASSLLTLIISLRFSLYL